jgi:hypothetical protein
LRGLPALDWIELGQTPLDDRAVPHLLALKGLKQLNVAGTKLSAAGLKQLREGLPQCKITP